MPRSRGRNDNNIREDNPRENSRPRCVRWHSSHQRRKRRPGIVDDYRSTFAKVKAMKIDVLLGPRQPPPPPPILNNPSPMHAGGKSRDLAQPALVFPQATSLTPSLPPPCKIAFVF